MEKTRLSNSVLCPFPSCRLVVKWLVATLLLFCVHNVQAQRGQQLFTFSLPNATVAQLFERLEKDSKYTFVYDAEDMSTLGRRDFNFSNAPIRSILNRLFDRTAFEFSVKDDHITVVRKGSGPVTNKTTVVATLKGTVTDPRGNPVIGASVYMKNTRYGTTTDTKGGYELRIPAEAIDIEDITIVFSYIGMTTTERNYNLLEDRDLDVQLQESTQSIDDVVVRTGYQAVESKNVSAAITTIKAEDILVPALNTIDQMLEGYVPGMVFMQNTGQSGASPRLRIRGTSTILGSQEPLWVVDGIVQEDPVNVDPALINDLDFVNLLGNAISGLNPEDIEQIDVLKDASATAIYGARAANGVIVVTTKSGKTGPPRVSYSGSVVFSQRPSYSSKYVNMMNSSERVELSREIIQNRLYYPSVQTWTGYEKAIMDYWDGNLSFSEMNSLVGRYETLNTDWFKLLTKNSWTNKHSVSVSGGNEILNYYSSIGLSVGPSNIRHEKNNTLTGLVKITANLNDFTLRFSAHSSYRDARYIPTDVNLINYAYNTSRAIEAYEENGDYAFYKLNNSLGERVIDYNILNDVDNSNRDVNTMSNVFTAEVAYRFHPTLRGSVIASHTMSSTKDRSFYGESTSRSQDLRLRGDYEEDTEKVIMPFGGELLDATTNHRAYTIRAQFDYNQRFGTVHYVNAVLGGEIYSSRYKTWSQTVRGYMPERGYIVQPVDPATYPAYYNWYTSDDEARGVRDDALTNKVSLYAVAKYDYDERYLIDVGMRLDASNQFGTMAKEKVLPVWSISGRWNVKRDLFSNSKIVNSLSIKASIGIQGNMHTGQSSRLVIEKGAYDEYLGGFGSSVKYYANPNLRWEKVLSQNYGVDFSLFNRVVSGTFSYWRKRTRDAYLNKSISWVNGRESYVVNSGEVHNNGTELSLRFTPVNRVSGANPEGFRWQISPSFSVSKNKLTESNGTTDQSVTPDFTYTDYIKGTVNVPGRPLNALYSYQFAGLSPVDGRPMFRNIGEEMEETYNNITKEEVFAYVFNYSGNRVPTMQGSITNNFTYRRFALSLNLAYSFGNKVRLLNLYPNINTFSGTLAPEPLQNVRREFANRWRAPGDEKRTNIPGLINADEFAGTMGAANWWYDKSYVFGSNIWNMYDASDLRVASGNYLRMQSMALRYTLPEAAAKKMFMQTAYVAFSATNLFTLCSSKLKGQDPTTQDGTSSTLNMSYRPTYSLTVNFSF